MLRRKSCKAKGSVSPQHHIQWLLPSASPCSSSSRPPLGCPTCTATLKGQVSTATPPAGGCRSFQNSPGERQSPPPLPGGTIAGPCLGSACKNQAVLRDRPRSRKGHRQAASWHQQPEHGRAGTLCPPGLSAPRSTVLPSATSEAVLPCLLAPQPSLLHDCHRGTLPASRTSSAHSPHIPGSPAQPEAGERQPCSPLHGPPSAFPGCWR